MTHNPSAIETYKWTMLVLGKACKPFGVKVNGFEQEILDMILTMEQRRQLQIQMKKQNSMLKNKRKQKSNKKGELSDWCV